MMRRRPIALLAWLVVVALSFATAACSGQQKPAQPEPSTQQPAAEPSPQPEPSQPSGPVILRIATTDDLINLDPAHTSQAGDRWLAQNIFRGLVAYKAGTTEIEPGVARDWEVSPDGKAYTFHLRQGVQFHHGYGEMTSADVKFSLERHMDPEVNSLARSDFAIVERIDAPDKYTVVIYLKQPSAGFLGILAWQPAFIISQKAAGELGKDIAFKPVGAGPFYLDRWTKGQEVVLKRHDAYYGGAAQISELQFRVIKEELVALLALERGEVDVVPIRQLAAFRTMVGQEGRFNITDAPSGYYLLYLNNTTPPFNDVRVRRAVSHALDQAAISQALGGMIKPSPSIFSPVTLGYTTDLPAYEYSPERAKALLQEAGYPDGFPVTINYTQSFLYEELAMIIKEQWAKIGLEVTLQPVDRALVSKMRREKSYQALPGSITRFEPDQHVVFFMTGASTNFTGYSSAPFDDLVDRQRVEMNAETRKQLLKDLQAQVAEDVPVIPLGAFQSILVAQKNVKGIVAPLYEGMIDYYLVRVEQ